MAKLSKTEQRVRDAFPRGVTVDLREAPDRAIRGEFLKELLLSGVSAASGFVARLALVGAEIAGPLDLADAEITAPVSLTECTFDAEVSLANAKTRGIDLSGSTLVSMAARQVRIEGDLVLRGLSADRVELAGARVSGILVLNHARVQIRIQAARLAVEHSVYGVGLHAEELYLVGASVEGGLHLPGARLGKLLLEHTRVRGLLDLGCEAGEIDLRHAAVGVLRDDPASGMPVRLDGLTYDALDPVADVKARLHWLAAEPSGYRPLPYEQLAKTYRGLGHETEARRVLLAKQRRRRATLPAPARLWGLVQDWVVGYGYLPGRAAAWLLGLLAVGTTLFWIFPPSAIQPGVRFNPFVYALDVLLPVVRLGQETAFFPAGAGMQWTAYALTGAGWLLVTTVAAGLARGLTRN